MILKLEEKDSVDHSQKQCVKHGKEKFPLQKVEHKMKLFHT